MARGNVTDGIAQAKALLTDAGLNFPPIPAELAPLFKERGKWWFASSEPVRFSPYAYFPYVEAGTRKRVRDYVLLAHDGHGANSYALHYYLVHQPLRLFLQVGWGGVYTDSAKATEEVNRCFALVEQLVRAVKAAVRSGHLRANDRLLVAASEFAGCYWLKPGEDEKHQMPETPRLALTTVLRWAEGLTT